jgi:ABC-2 type transport system permease protein
MNRRRILALVRRHLYVTSRSFPRLMDWLFWPAIDLLLWGFLTSYFRHTGAEVPTGVGFLLGGFLLWDILFRSENGIALAYMEETWSRSVVNLLASPVTPGEYVTGAMLWGLARVAVGWTIITTLAGLLFSFSVRSYGLAVAPFAAALLLFGVALSMVVLGLVLRFGNGASILAWAITGFIMPLSAVFYPVSVLPGWARAITTVFPSAQVFESMRTVLAGEGMPWGRLGWAFALDAIYLGVALWFVRRMFAALRQRGYVTRFM